MCFFAYIGNNQKARPRLIAPNGGASRTMFAGHMKACIVFWNESIMKFRKKAMISPSNNRPISLRS